MEQRPPVTWRDAALPAAFLVLGTFELWNLGLPNWPAGVALEALGSALLVLRRRNPLVFATGATLAVLTMPWVGAPLDDPAVPVMYVVLAIYSLGRWVADYRGLAGVAVTLAMTLGDYLLVDERAYGLSDVFFVLSLAVPPYILGRVARQLADRAELLERHQELVRRDAVRDERDRIARELHDVIAHSVSAMVVQTAAAQDLVRTDPDKAERVLSDVASTGRRALAETGRLLHVLRDEDDELGLDPAPGMREVPALVEQFRASGLAVDLELPEAPPGLEPGVDVSVYRIAQEALTNALKHGSGGRAALRVTATPQHLAVDACNPVNGARGQGSGLGLLGIRERVGLHGGRLDHGVDGDVFRLSVTLPLAPSTGADR